MLLSRVSPLELLNEMQRSFSLIDEMSRAARPAYSRTTFPPLNGWSDEQNYYLEAELPGFCAEALNLSLAEGQVLTIQGERKLDESAEQRNWIRRERGYGTFERQIALPGPVQEDKVEARFKDGVLLITLPKAVESRPRRIEVTKG
jgi:HSP20 family protein